MRTRGEIIATTQFYARIDIKKDTIIGLLIYAPKCSGFSPSFFQSAGYITRGISALNGAPHCLRHFKQDSGLETRMINQ